MVKDHLKWWREFKIVVLCFKANRCSFETLGSHIDKRYGMSRFEMIHCITSNQLYRNKKMERFRDVGLLPMNCTDDHFHFR